jgi:ADP-ribosylglycohydrolase
VIGAIAGDIVGSRFEGGSPPPARFELFHPACRFTDDTVCSLAVAEALLRGADFAATLRAFVRRHPRRGYGGMFRKWAFADDAPPYGSWGNGAPMRVAPVGWLAGSESEARRLAREQAAVSHDHPDALAAAEAVALAVFLLARGQSAEAVRRSIADAFGYELDPARSLSRGFDASARGTAPAALTLALNGEDWEGTVRAAVGLGGDTDTLACIAGALAEAIHGVPASVRNEARAFLTADLLETLDAFEAARLAR